ncbi:MAG TPA: hypothetical protein VFV99_29435 [Kofleriaceae bacterium]|nr:hypothetical protein [Kofleriaceae bacterium]
MSEWDQRQLCPDGACVGVIGDDGTCKVCGRAAPNWGDERNRGLVDENDHSDESQPPPESVTKSDKPLLYFDVDKTDEGDAKPDADWDQRKLCPDDACIGVIGADGTCKVCGRSAA